MTWDCNPVGADVSDVSKSQTPDAPGQGVGHASPDQEPRPLGQVPGQLPAAASSGRDPAQPR